MTETIELIALVLTVKPVEGPALGEAARPLPAWWGRAAHSLLLRLVNEADPALATRLHDDNGLHPFTASTLMGHFPEHRPDPTQSYTLRLTATQEPVANILLQAARPGGTLAPGAIFELDYLPFQVQAAVWDAKDHPWAGAASYQGLLAASLVGSPADKKVTLQFASPTGFRQNGRLAPLPLPDLVFGSLLERWNAFAPLAFPPEMRRYAEECLLVSRFKLESRAVPAEDAGLRLGAVGQATYTTSNYDRYWMSLAHTLAAFALFSGVGLGVSMGMGQTRPVAME